MTDDGAPHHRPRTRGRWLRRVLPPATAGTAVLLSAALFCVTRGLAYLPYASDGSIRQLTVVEGWAPIPVWSGVWLAVAGAMFASAWRPRYAVWPLSAFAGLNAAWGMSYLWSWIAGDVGRGWVTGALFLAVAVWSIVMPGLIERRGR